jgi:galactose-6-phosphate isomerase
MAELDVSELMTDPDFVSSFTVIRAGQTIDEHGRAQVAAQAPKKILGAVFPISARTMNMMPDYVNVNGSIEIYTKFRLEGPSTTTQADTVIWQGNTYLVANVQSYSHFGAGHIRAVCQLKDLLANAPSNTVSSRGP